MTYRQNVTKGFKKNKNKLLINNSESTLVQQNINIFVHVNLLKLLLIPFVKSLRTCKDSSASDKHEGYFVGLPYTNMFTLLLYVGFVTCYE